MSIEYFVEGDIREHFNGDIKVYTKGNIVYSSQKSVQMLKELLHCYQIMYIE